MGATATAKGLSCEACQAPLPMIGERSPTLLFTAFPWMLGNCVMHLAAGPSALPCEVCPTVTKLPLAQVVVGPDGGGVLYLPDDRAGPDTAREAETMASLPNLPSGVPKPLQVVRSEQEFRRAFSMAFIEPAASLLNDWVQDEGPPLEWVARNLDRLDASFFGAIHLLGMGLLPLFKTPIHPASSSFVPHEAAPPEASHVVRRHEAQEQVARRGGDVLGFLLIHWAKETFEARSFLPFLEAVDEMLPPGGLLDPTAQAAADRIEHLLSNFTLGEPGATVTHYIAEALLALLLGSRGTLNPRLKDWTLILLRYEFERRLDGNGEELLLDPDLLKPKLDTALFWQAVRAYGRKVGEEGDERKRLERTSMLLETVARLFPEEANRFAQVELHARADMADTEALESTGRLLIEAASDLPEKTALLRGGLMGLARRRGHLLEGAIKAAIEACLDQTAPAARLCRIAREGIEALHVAREFGAAARLAEAALAQLDEANEQGFTADEQLHLLNEVGNTRRYGADYRGALAIYDEILGLIGNDVKKRNTRVVMRNRAIVLRELHRYEEAIGAFGLLRRVAQDNEKIGLIVSEAACLGAMGDDTAAARLMNEHVGLVEGKGLSEAEPREFMLALAQLRLQEGNVEDAAKLADVLEQYVETQDDSTVRLIAARIRLRLAVRSGTLDQATAAAAVDALRKATKAAEQMPGLPNALLAATEELDLALRKSGQAEAAEKTLRELLETGISMETSRGWLLHVMALRHAIRRRDLEATVGDVIGGMWSLGSALDRLAAESDAPAFLAPNQDSLDELVAQALSLVEHGPPNVGLLARAAGDLRAAPVLTARLRDRAGLKAGMEDTAAEVARLAALLPADSVTAVQAIEADGEVALLLTRASGGKGVSTEVRRLPVSIAEAAEVAAGLPLRLRRVRADARAITIARLDQWQPLAAALCETLSDLPPDRMLAISPGPIGSLAFSLALGAGRPICFAPSLGALLALRAARLALPGGRAWQPANMLDFSVWFNTERAEEAASLAAAPERGAAIAARYGLGHRALAGREGTAANLLSALEGADVARIACHGRILAEEEAVDLIVAADGRLPPANLSTLLDLGRAPHILSWRRIAALPRAPLVVFSSACDSGATVLHQGGERLGLERAFFAAGSIAYIAPQWPVPTIAMQHLMDNLVAKWIDDPSRPLAHLVRDERVAAQARGEPALAVEALAVFGDGL
jgi:tetratricopeptide (TPR) repeat protein